MFDSPITLILLAASALVSFTAARRRWRAKSAPPALATLSDADLLATLAALEAQGTNARITAQPGAARPARHSISVTHSPSEMRDPRHLVSANHEIRRRITLLVIEEIERRGLGSNRHGGGGAV